MAPESVAALVQVIGQCGLLEEALQAELSATLQGRFAEPKDLARELVKRDWLTPYQVNQIFQGHGPDLVLGGYVLLERLGEGGMGQVFKARHQKLNRLVALKVIRRDHLVKPDAVRRFRREIRASAQLSHPNIVLAFDAAEFSGTNVLVMEYVAGTDLAKLVKQNGPLPVDQACDYVRQAALALQHAHERGLVHRDIKPSNLLLTDKGGQIKLLDLGLARAPQEQPTAEEAGSLTATGTILGSPDFISPEQARNSRAADIRGDLYSLGCTFYFLLTGQVPFPTETITEKLYKHWFEEPRPIQELRPEVPAELIEVVGRLMAKRPEGRYETPRQLAATLEVWQRTGSLPETTRQVVAVPTMPAAQRPRRDTDQAITEWTSSQELELAAANAEPSRTLALTPRQERRVEAERRWRRWVMAGVALILGGLAFVVVLYRLQTFRPSHEAGQAAVHVVTVGADQSWQDTGVDVEAGQSILISARGEWKKGQETCTANGLASAPRDRAVWPAAPLMCLLARVGADDALYPLGKLRTIQPKTSGRLFARANDLDRKDHSGALDIEIEGGTLAATPAPAPGRTPLESADEELETLLSRPPRAQADAIAWRVAVLAFRRQYPGTPQARRAAALLTRLPSSLDLLQSQDIPPEERWAGQPRELVAVLGRQRWQHWDQVTCMAFSADGRLAASGGQDQVVRLWDLAQGKELATLAERGMSGILAVAFAPQGRTCASGSADGAVRLWDTATGKNLATLPGHAKPVNCVTFAPDGSTLASGGDEKMVLLWDVAGTKQLKTCSGHQASVSAVAFAPDGKRLASGGDDGIIKLWDPASGVELFHLPGHQGRVNALTFDLAGGWLLSGGKDGVLKVWDPGAGKLLANLPSRQGEVASLAYAAGRGLAASGGKDSTIKLWDMAAGKERHAFTTHAGIVSAMGFSADGTMVSAGTSGERTVNVKRWDVAGGKELSLQEGLVSPTTALALSPDGQTVVLGSANGRIHCWTVANGQFQETLSWHGQSAAITGLACAPDGQSLASGAASDTGKLWDAKTGQELFLLGGQKGQAAVLAYSPGGQILASASGQDGSVRLWDTATGKSRAVLQGHSGRVLCLNFAPDGLTLASGSDDQGVRLWDLSKLPASSSRVLPPSHKVWVTVVAFSPDGQTLISGGGGDGWLRVSVWNGNEFKERFALEGHHKPVRAVAVAPDGQTLVSAGQDGRLIHWNLETGKKVKEQQFPGPVEQVAFAADGRHLFTVNGNGTIYVLRLAAAPEKKP